MIYNGPKHDGKTTRVEQKKKKTIFFLAIMSPFNR